MTPEEYLNSINIDRELKMLARCNKHASRNNNAIYKTYCLDLGEFEKENNMSNSSIIKSCDNCKYADRPGYAWPCTDCLVHNKWEKRNIPQSNKKQNIVIPAIKDVIFNPPATIIIWEDKTKTVVKCGEGDIYNPEKGMAMAISRKALGDKWDYYNTFKHWLKKWEKDHFGAIIEPKVGSCMICKYVSDNPWDKPCDTCNHNGGSDNKFEPKETDICEEPEEPSDD